MTSLIFHPVHEHTHRTLLPPASGTSHPMLINELRPGPSSHSLQSLVGKSVGAPGIVQTASGYTMTYANPVNGKEKLTITGSRELMFFLYYPPNLKGTDILNGVATEVSEPQVWKKSLIAGQSVKWYHASLPSADRGGVFKTLGTGLKDNSGSSGSYRIVAEGTKKQMQTWLSELRFRL